MSKLDGILETAIHTLDMWRSRAFYESVPRLTPFFRIHARSAHTAATHESDMLSASMNLLLFPPAFSFIRSDTSVPTAVGRN